MSSESISHIVVFPYNLNLEQGPDGDPEAILSVLSCMAVDAAVAVWRDNRDARIVIPGATPFPKPLPDTTDLMIERAQAAADIPEKQFVGLHELSDGTPLNNTHLQAEAVWEYFDVIEKDRSVDALTVALAYHLMRAVQACEVRSINTTYQSAESILNQHGQLKEYERYLPLFKKLNHSERFLSAFNSVDRQGRILNWYTGLAGARVVDFVEVEEVDTKGNAQTSIKLENMTAAKKFKQVTGIPMYLYHPSMS